MITKPPHLDAQLEIFDSVSNIINSFKTDMWQGKDCDSRESGIIALTNLQSKLFEETMRVIDRAYNI